MAKKLDLSGVKNFMFKYGERVALFTCIGVAVLLIASGLTGAVGSGTPSGDPWDKAIAKAAKDLKDKLPIGGDPDPDKVKQFSKTAAFSWPRLDPRASTVPYLSVSENLDTRRTNPLILAVLPDIDEVQNIQRDYLYRGHLGHEVLKKTVLTVVGGGDKGQGGGGLGGGEAAKDSGAGGTNLASVLKPRHMLVVTGLFPMKTQVDQFLKALRITSVSELQKNGELPHILGINVYRDERDPFGKETRTKLIFFEDGQLIVESKLDKDMQQAIYNHSNPTALKPLIHEGLVTPLPRLPDGLKYPELRIKTENWPQEDLLAAADDVPANPKGDGKGVPGGPPGGMLPKGSGGILGPKKGMDPKGGNPDGGGEAPNEPKTEFVPLKKFESNKELYDRLTGKYNIFHPYGQLTDAKDAKAERFGFAAQGEGNAGEAGPGGGVNKPNMPAGSGSKLPDMKEKVGDKSGVTPAGGLAIYDAIVRFVDVDLTPGCTYTYHIQVRVQNPNFGKKNEVAQQNWAGIKELTSTWTTTKPFTVPDTFHLYAVDQFLVDKMGITDPKELNLREKQHKKLMDGNHAVLQLHRWFDKGGPQLDLLISDWAVADAVVVRKGEPIGNTNTVVKIPTWSNGRGAFEMRTTPVGKISMPGVSLDFVPPAMAAEGKRIDGVAPLLVDFAGGHKNVKFGTTTVIEEAAMDVLILTPDGRLIVHNSRADTDAKVKDGTEEGTSRQKRVVEWRARSQAPADGDAPAAKKGGNILGGPK
jgi:hypothetical protein